MSIEKKKALVTGITGQDGAYLSELLLNKGYEVHGIVRRSSSRNTHRIDHISGWKEAEPRIKLHYGDLTDTSSLFRIIEAVSPDEIYNLAAQSHVQVSFETPEYTANADGLGVLRILEALRTIDSLNSTRFYQASTSEMFGLTDGGYLSESSPFHPRSPYGAAKLYGYWITRNYREAYGIHGVNGILFNHESPRRSENFVTRKIVKGAVQVMSGSLPFITLGNLDSKRDWGHARDYVEGMWLMLQHPLAQDWVLATGIEKSVREFVEMVFLELGETIRWSGKGLEEKGFLLDGRMVVTLDSRYLRPSEVPHLLGDARKAREELGWQPRTQLKELVREMVVAELKFSREDAS